MNIFIDEAGTFTIPSDREWSISCVGALVIPEQETEEVLLGFKNLKEKWGIKNGEIKGSKLNELEIASVISFLSQFDVIFEVTAIDMKMQTQKGLTTHRILQTDKFTVNITNQHKQTLIQSLREVQNQLRKMSNQLYVQAVCNAELLHNLIQKTTLYFAQRKPKELAEFNWVIDAKQERITTYEELWKKILPLMLQSKSFRKTFIQLEEADYSYFAKYCGEMPESPDHLKKALGNISPFEYIKIGEICKNLRFQQSHENLCLQIADILTTAIRRAMNGNLQIKGWEKIGHLMVRSERNYQTIHLINLSGNKQPIYKSKKPPYWEVIHMAERTFKSILTAN